MNKNHKFKVGDTVDIVSGPHNGKSTTITFVDETVCGGYFCGRYVAFKHEDAKYYGDVKPS